MTAQAEDRIEFRHVVVFVFTFALYISDYMCRQLINIVFPILKVQWGLSDTKLGALVSVVLLAVGLLSIPLSLLADRFGRAKSIALMAIVWSLATLACGLATNYGQMLLARLAVGAGEAAYGSVGVAVLLGMFPRRMHTTVIGLFFAASSLGSTLGLAAGGALAAQFGWRGAFYAMAALGLVLAITYPIVVSDQPGATISTRTTSGGSRPQLTWDGVRTTAHEIFTTRSVLCTYIATALQLFVFTGFIAWMPSLLNRVYQMPLPRAASFASLLVLMSGAGVILCSALADQVNRRRPGSKGYVAAAYCMLAVLLLSGAFLAPHGPVQLTVLGAGLFFVGAAPGVATSLIADVSRPAIHATVIGVAALMNALCGQAPGPLITGILADHFNLLTSLRIVPAVGIAAAAFFLAAQAYYWRDVAQVAARST